MLLNWCLAFLTTHLDVNERHNLGLKSIFWCLDDNNEFLTHLSSNLKSDLLLQFLSDWILNEPAIELNFGVLDE